jgi:hypothetical protein
MRLLDAPEKLFVISTILAVAASGQPPQVLRPDTYL